MFQLLIRTTIVKKSRHSEKTAKKTLLIVHFWLPVLFFSSYKRLKFESEQN